MSAVLHRLTVAALAMCTGIGDSALAQSLEVGQVWRAPATERVPAVEFVIRQIDEPEILLDATFDEPRPRIVGIEVLAPAPDWPGVAHMPFSEGALLSGDPDPLGWTDRPHSEAFDAAYFNWLAGFRAGIVGIFELPVQEAYRVYVEMLSTSQAR